ncbi:MAG TPA: mycofactocin system transcriptional regulator [Pseudolysinimonas sp.]|nr:mycofactocin system transcriptional regulator [Pseudolysinimonas sp.]
MTAKLPPRQLGRKRSSTRAELSHIALQLFVERGFEQTTMDDVAAAAGIGRRTLFRYFPSKNDLPWGDFDDLLTAMRAHLARVPADQPLVDALREAIIEFNRIPTDEVPYHRQRMTLLLTVPTLAAHSTLRYSDWRAVIAEFVAARRGVDILSLQPQAMAWAFLGVSISAYERWLRDDRSDLVELLDSAYDMLGSSFDESRHR